MRIRAFQPALSLVLCKPGKDSPRRTLHGGSEFQSLPFWPPTNSSDRCNVKYLFDNCISYKFARMLAASRSSTKSLHPRQIPGEHRDVELFRQLKNLDYVFVTSDVRQRTREQEARGIKEAGLTGVWFGPFWSKKSFWDQAKWIIMRWPK